MRNSKKLLVHRLSATCFSGIYMPTTHCLNYLRQSVSGTELRVLVLVMCVLTNRYMLPRSGSNIPRPATAENVTVLSITAGAVPGL